MDFGESGGNVILLIVLGVIMMANIFFRKRKTESTPMGMVVGIFSEVDHNENLAGDFGAHRGAAKFKTVSWKRGREKIDFLPQELRTTIATAFNMVEEVNERIDAAKKFGSGSYLEGIDVSRLKAPLAKSKQGLQAWLEENMNKPEYAPPKRRGLFG